MPTIVVRLTVALDGHQPGALVVMADTPRNRARIAQGKAEFLAEFDPETVVADIDLPEG